MLYRIVKLCIKYKKHHKSIIFAQSKIRYMKIKKEPKEIKRELRSYLIIAFGLLVNSFSWTAFLIPSEIVGGGITGAGSLVYYATGFPVFATFLLANIVLIIIGIKKLGFGFGIKTLFGIGGLSLFLGILQPLFPEPIVSDKFMAAIIGGILGGASIGLIFSQGGSTGGTDIIALIINKYRNISQGKIILAIDVLIISSSFILFRSWETLVYGYVSMGVASYSIDMFLNGYRQSVQMFIFSKKHEELASIIANDLGRGVTFLKAKGWYSKEDTEVLMVIMKRNQTSNVYRTIKHIDPDAFISVGNVMGVYGKGFDPIRP